MTNTPSRADAPDDRPWRAEDLLARVLAESPSTDTDAARAKIAEHLHDAPEIKLRVIVPEHEPPPPEPLPQPPKPKPPARKPDARSRVTKALLLAAALALVALTITGALALVV